ncbi:MAG: acyl-CoA dehydrogenase family protein [Chloroflexi bacterium]|nr:acyl-CoA dehydrogenase family protein [Chloroflexota bacterium]
MHQSTSIPVYQHTGLGGLAMDFTLSEEQEMFRAMFRDFSAKEVAPKAEEIDHEERPPLDVLRKAANQGFLGATLPEDYFGAELDYLSYALLIQTLAGDCMSTAVTLATHVSLVAMSILEHGTDAQKEEWLPQMAAGEVIGAFALTEPDAGSDAASLQTRAFPSSPPEGGGQEGEVILDGVKTWVANGEIAGLFLVFAQGPDGIEPFLVPKDAPGLTLGYREPTLGLRSVTFNTLYLEGCRVPQANRLGEPGEGWTVAQRARDRMAIALAAAGLGVSEAAVNVAAQYATERVQFGVPIAQKQAIQNYVAEAFAQVEALRYLVYHAAWLADQDGGFSLDASVVKAFSARVARSVTNRMVQVMGGYGYMEDYPMARKYRDARALGIIGGPTELHYVWVAQRIFADLDLEIVP